MAARAMAVMAPMVVAWVMNSSSCQIASIRSASRPMMRGARWSARRRMTEEPPVPMV